MSVSHSPKSATDPVVILIHGAALNGVSWNPVRRLIDPRITVVTPDLPGHGARGGETYTLAGAIETIAAAARAVYPAPVILGGDSLGGYASTAAASTLPAEQLKGCILSGCSANLTGAAVVPFLIKKLATRISLAMLSAAAIDKSLAKTLRSLDADEADITDILAAGMHLSVFPQAVDATRGVDFLSMAAKIKQPVLFVNGGKDGIAMRQQPTFLAATPAARAHCFEDAEHGVSINRSAGFATLVNGFALPLFGLNAAAA